MPNLSAGASASQFIGPSESLNLVLDVGESCRFWFVPQNAEAPPPVGSSRSLGPGACNQTFGPWGVPGTVNIACDAGTIVYTVNGPTAAPVAATTLSASGATTLSGAVTANPASAAVSIAPSGTGNATFGASGTGSTTLQRVGSFTAVGTDSSGTPGAATINTLAGKAAFAAAASTVTITSSLVTANSIVLAVLQQADSTLTDIIRVVPAAGSFVVTGNAAATAATAFSFVVINRV